MFRPLLKLKELLLGRKAIPTIPAKKVSVVPMDLKGMADHQIRQYLLKRGFRPQDVTPEVITKLKRVRNQYGPTTFSSKEIPGSPETSGILGTGGELSDNVKNVGKVLAPTTGLATIAKIASGNSEDDPLQQNVMPAVSQEAPVETPTETPVEAPGFLDRLSNLPDAVKYGVPLGALAVGTGAVGLRRVLKNRK